MEPLRKHKDLNKFVGFDQERIYFERKPVTFTTIWLFSMIYSYFLNGKGFFMLKTENSESQYIMTILSIKKL